MSKSVEIDRSNTPFIIGGVLLVGLILTGGSILWAQNNGGQIDVSATIAHSQYGEENDTGENDTTPSVTPTTPEQAAMPNGGLQAQSPDAPRAPEPPLPTQSDSASTTASSTEPVSGDENVSGGSDPETSEEVRETEDTTPPAEEALPTP